MVETTVDGAAAAVVVDQIGAPQGARAVQGLGHEHTDQPLEFGVIAGVREGQVVDVGADVKVGVAFPVHAPDGGRTVHDALGEAAEAGDQARAQGVDQPVIVDVAGAEHDAVNDHGVGGLVHAEPGGVHV